jgi:hypothetical protein
LKYSLKSEALVDESPTATGCSYQTGIHFYYYRIDTVVMQSLLVQSCSATKNEVPEPVPALELYDGYFFKIIKKAIREGVIRPDLDMRILSAKYGIVDPDEPIEYYDQQMTADRAEELRPTVTETLCQLVSENDYERVVVNTGEVYSQALDEFLQQVDVRVETIDGDGIGTKGKLLKEYVRGEMDMGVTS